MRGGKKKGLLSVWWQQVIIFLSTWLSLNCCPSLFPFPLASHHSYILTAMGCFSASYFKNQVMQVIQMCFPIGCFFLHIHYLSRHCLVNIPFITLQWSLLKHTKVIEVARHVVKAIDRCVLCYRCLLPSSRILFMLFSRLEYLWRCNHVLSVNNCFIKVLKQGNQYLIAQVDSGRLWMLCESSIAVLVNRKQA